MNCKLQCSQFLNNISCIVFLKQECNDSCEKTDPCGTPTYGGVVSSRQKSDQSRKPDHELIILNKIISKSTMLSNY